MCLKWCKEVTNPPTQVSLIDDDSRIDFELTLFATNIKKEFYGVMEHSFFIKRFEEMFFITCYI
jgi:hypothetical protein